MLHLTSTTQPFGTIAQDMSNVVVKGNLFISLLTQLMLPYCSRQLCLKQPIVLTGNGNQGKVIKELSISLM